MEATALSIDINEKTSSRIGVRRTVGALCLIVVLGGLAWRSTRMADSLELVDTFDQRSRMPTFMQPPVGGQAVAGGLALRGGETAVRRYRITRAADHRSFIRVKKGDDPRIEAELMLLLGAFEVASVIDGKGFDGRPIDVTSLTEPGSNWIELRLSNRAPPGTPPLLALESFAIERRGERHPTAGLPFAFYWGACVFFWVGLAAFIIPGVASEIRTDWSGSAIERGRLIAALLILVGCVAWLCLLPEWRSKKDYDDRTAISNGATLIESGYDPSALYFRSRVRPGFLSMSLPLLVLSPHRFYELWFNPSDFHLREWLIYDEDNGSFGLAIYPTLSLAALASALAMICLLYAIYRRLDISPLTAFLAAALFSLYFGRSLAIAVTQTTNLLVNLAAVWAFLAWGRGGSAGPKFAAGLFMGFAFIVKETALTTALCLILFLLSSGPLSLLGARLRASIPFWIGAAFWPLLFFGFVSEGGFAELFANFDEHLRQQELNQFESLTVASGLKDLWSVFSVGLPIAILGLAVSARKKFASPGARFLICWTIGCLPVFTLPYIFPRFLQYMIPSFSIWTVIGLEFLGSWTLGKHWKSVGRP